MNSSGKILLADLISPDTINLNLQGADREAVFEQLVDQVPELAQQPQARQTLLKALHEREQLHSTGIGDGVALPHARNALVGLVGKPVIIFGRHAKGIPYDAIDGGPAKLFFLVIAPTVTQHLSVLARISRLLRDAAVRNALLSADTAKKAHSLIREAEAEL